MQYHCINIESNTINTLNPGQIPLDTADQSTFTPAKKLTIQFPNKFGLNKDLCLFVSLHKETFLLIICGQVIKCSGLDETLCTCGMSIAAADV